MKWYEKPWLPALVTLLISSSIIAVVIINAGGDALELARLGTQYSLGAADGTQGYDGQFVYYIAKDLNPEAVADHLDVPAYRYQRILLPLLGHVFSAGDKNLLPWVLPLLGLLAHTLGTWLVAVLLKKWHISSWYASIYGLWVGFVLAVRLDLPEPLAYALVAAALLAMINDRHTVAWVLFGLSLFSKEVTLIFVVALGLSYLLHTQWRRAVGVGIVAVLPFTIFQFWLRYTFGAFGIGSGGDMATPFEWIPLMGLWRIGVYSPVFLAATMAVFGPFVILPSLWGIWMAVKHLSQRSNSQYSSHNLDSDGLQTEQRSNDFIALALGFQSVSILFLPFSTFREPGGLLRYACGLVLAVLLFAAKHKHRRVLRYAPFWLVLNVILLKR
ncbi:MAG: hypothetical protein U9Q82_16345 [Chloroflexota bacterium]|nr:hypothetical protein [Chloroflexota bacterium]